MIFSFFYDLALFIAFIIALPKILYQKYFLRKYKKSLKAKWGKDFFKIKESQNLIWIHAVSMGETKGVAPLAKLLKEEYKDSTLLVTSTTETGHEEAKKSIKEADYHLFLPFDFSFIIGPIVKRLKPKMIILGETDFWYHFLKFGSSVRAKIFLVNGKISERSLKRFSLVPFFTKKVFAPFSLLCLQSERYKERFETLPIPKDKLKVTGNLKLDIPAPILTTGERKILEEKLQVTGAKVVVAGSTHNPEEELLLNAYQELIKKIPNLKLILVPRHPERFNEVAKLIESKNIPFTKFSELGAKRAENVILVDSMGKLMSCYQLATVAFVGGSLASHVGGHNIFEPLYYGVPVLFGPFMYTQLDFVDLVLEGKAGLMVEKENLTDTLFDLLTNDQKREALGRAGVLLANEQRGGTLKTATLIQQLVK